jgi:hypothetical protein
MPTDLSKHARTLVEQYRLVNGVFKMRVRDTSPWIGSLPDAIDVTAYPGLGLIGFKSSATDRSPAALGRRHAAGQGRCRGGGQVVR